MLKGYMVRERLGTPGLDQDLQTTARGQGRIKGWQRGQLPRVPRCKGGPRDEIYLFQINYSFEKFL